jgi:hypothetical protein
MLLSVEVIIIVKSSRDAEGRKAYSTRGQLFDGTVDGCWSSAARLSRCLMARVCCWLMAIDPATKLVMRHEGQEHDALRATVGAAAKLTVEEGKRRPVFRPWRPRETAGTALPDSSVIPVRASPTAAGSPPMRQKEEAGI